VWGPQGSRIEDNSSWKGNADSRVTRREIKLQFDPGRYRAEDDSGGKKRTGGIFDVIKKGRKRIIIPSKKRDGEEQADRKMNDNSLRIVNRVVTPGWKGQTHVKKGRYQPERTERSNRVGAQAS